MIRVLYFVVTSWAVFGLSPFNAADREQMRRDWRSCGQPAVRS